MNEKKETEKSPDKKLTQDQAIDFGLTVLAGIAIGISMRYAGIDKTYSTLFAILLTIVLGYRCIINLLVICTFISFVLKLVITSSGGYFESIHCNSCLIFIGFFEKIGSEKFTLLQITILLLPTYFWRGLLLSLRKTENPLMAWLRFKNN